MENEKHEPLNVSPTARGGELADAPHGDIVATGNVGASSAVIDKLLAWATSATRLVEKEVLGELEAGNSAGYWREFLPEESRQLWAKLPLEARLVLFIEAYDRCDSYDEESRFC